MTKQFVAGVTVMLKACLGRIIDLRREEVKLSNAILICTHVTTVDERAIDDYFGVLELPSLLRKRAEVLK
jgi:hypothetical protein